MQKQFHDDNEKQSFLCYIHLTVVFRFTLKKGTSKVRKNIKRYVNDNLFINRF